MCIRDRSVIIPVYNAERFIEKSYNSIINQQIDDFEIIYVNNNSIDNTQLEIDRISTKDARVTSFFQKKQGTSFARNLGISKASGDYVYIFDVDDEIYPNALKKMLEVLDNDKNMDAVFGKMVKSSKSISDTIKPVSYTHLTLPTIA